MAGDPKLERRWAARKHRCHACAARDEAVGVPAERAGMQWGTYLTEE